MFQPSQAQVREFFCAVYQKWLVKSTMEPLETLAALWIAEHPEYHDDLSDAQRAVERSYDACEGRTNPFLHLSMHLSISEQSSIDQPRGIQAAVERLTERLGGLHDAHHEVMEELGIMLFESQRSGQPPDGDAYVERVSRRARRGG